MKRGIARAAVVVGLLLVATIVTGDNGGFTVSISGPLANAVSDALPVDEVGDDLYDAQEAANDAVNETAGTSIDNYYIWVCVGDECVPVDPYEVDD